MISNIHPNAFEGLSNLEALYLDYNKIQSLPSDTLSPLRSLLHFSIAYNNITSVSGSLFVMNNNLETLNLGHNQLTAFDGNQFEALTNLEHVQLDHNQLKALDLRICKSTEIIVDKNQLESLELNKWTRFVSAWGNPIKKLILHEHYGTGRNYNFSFTQVKEITFFVNQQCCTIENLENFYIVTQSFGDLGQKLLDVNDWSCRFLQTLQYETPNGLVVNDVCTKLSEDRSIIPSLDYETTTEWSYTSPTRANANLGNRITNPEDFIASDEFRSTSTGKPRESMEDTSPSPNIFDGMNIETLPERRTTTEPSSYTAYIEEIFPAETTESYEKKCEKGIYKTVKTKVVGWKNKVVTKWNDWVG